MLEVELLPLPGTPILGHLRGWYRSDECARVGSPVGGLQSSGENGGLDGGVESFAELSWLGLGHRGRLEFYSVQVRLLSSGRARAGRRRRGGSRGPRS
ncbi:hypothetical protein Taro_004120 [Colocasia esculenta]|uniref:Uncharacterized protein n=1 Tax=Colocasia esculenta TaxID=4460 RepID=A0A843TQU7_COLES|nr:hypothetical protein [Colocasia esculenta]